MNKVILVNLGGQVYHLEESGYILLQSYLKEAMLRLENDPDKDEIVNDLEQAVAEKFNRFLSANKTVVTSKEVQVVIKEMGPVEGSHDQMGDGGAPHNPDEKTSVRRLYRIHEGKVLGGVCTGLAKYFNVDVVLVRIIFVALFLLTQGVAVFAYIIAMLVIPKAKSAEQIAEAYNETLTAQELVRRAREEFAEFSDKGEWKKWKHEMRQKIRQQRREWRSNNHCLHNTRLIRLMAIALVVIWIVGLVSIITKGMIFGFILPVTWPLWVVIVGWTIVINLFNGPLYRVNQGGCHGSFFTHLLWWTFIIWLVWHFIPGSHYHFHRAYEFINSGVEAIKNN